MWNYIDKLKMKRNRSGTSVKMNELFSPAALAGPLVVLQNMVAHCKKCFGKPLLFRPKNQMILLEIKLNK